MNPLLKHFNNLINHGFEFFGRYYSSYRGFVVDNADPDGLGRLQLRVPAVFGSQTMEYWAWQKNCYSGKDYGMQVIPNKKDMVWVSFENGDPRKPVWEYGHFGYDSAGVNEKGEDFKDIQNFWFKTPYGHFISFDDKNKWIKIATKEGHTLILEDDANLVSLIHKDGNKIIIDEEVVTINDGAFDGLVKVGELITKLNNVESDLNTLKSAVTTWVPVASDGGAALKAATTTWAAQTLTPTTQSDLEDTAVTH